MRFIQYTVAATLVAFVAGCTSLPQDSLPMEPNVLAIQHYRFGIEDFSISQARYNLYKHKDGVWEFVVAVQTGEALKRSKKLEKVLSAKPWFELTVLLKPDDLDLNPGKTLLQKEGYDRKRNQNLSNFYYFTHESVEEAKIRILEVGSDWIEAEVTGSTIVNGSRGVTPDVRISVKARFVRDQSLRRGVW